MFVIIETTGSQLVDHNGRSTGPETKQELSRHRTQENAERALAKLRTTMPLVALNCRIIDDNPPRVIVTYWRGDKQYIENAKTYRGAKRIASLTQNAIGPTYRTADGRELFDDGNGLWFEEIDDRRVYVV